MKPWLTGLRVTALISLAAALALLAPANATAGLAPRLSRLYRLSERSNFEQGCFPPCLCPILQAGPPRGTFRLKPAGQDGPFRLYEVRDLDLTLVLGEREVRITGSGKYRWGGEVAALQRLELDLRVGDDPPAHFDSGLVAIEAKFPDIRVVVSMHGMFCFDTALTIDASPVPRREIRRYRLVRPSSFEQGCFDPCDCPAGVPRPLRGTFRLVPLAHDPLFTRYAVLGVRWRVLEGRPPPARPRLRLIRGSGSYRVGGEFAVMQQMQLDLDLGDGVPARFDSGLVVGGGSFPSIDVGLSMHGRVCFDTAIDLHARPLEVPGRSAGATP